MKLRPLLRRSYEALRRPMSLVEARLPSRSPLRIVTSIALGLSDDIARRVIGDQGSRQAQSTTRPRPATNAPGDGQPEISDEVGTDREGVLEDVHNRQEHDAARSNKNLATIKRDVARTEARAQARTHRTEQR